MIWKADQFVTLLLEELLPAIRWRTPDEQTTLIKNLVDCNVISGRVSARRVRAVACQAAEHFRNSALKVQSPTIVKPETISIAWLSHWLLVLGCQLIYGQAPLAHDDRLFHAIGRDDANFSFFKDRLLLNFLKALERSTFADHFECTAEKPESLTIGSILQSLDRFEINIRPHGDGHSPAIVESFPPDLALCRTLQVVTHDLFGTSFVPVTIAVNRQQEVYMHGLADDHRDWLVIPAQEHAQQFFAATALMPSLGNYFRMATNVVAQAHRSRLPLRSTVATSQKAMICNHCLDIQVRASGGNLQSTVNSLGIQFNPEGEPHRLLIPLVRCGLSLEQTRWLDKRIITAQEELILNIAPLVEYTVNPSHW